MDHASLAAMAAEAASGITDDGRKIETDKAMATLQQTVAAGFRDAAKLRDEADFVPLRVRPDFQLLIMDLAMPDDPFRH